MRRHSVQDKVKRVKEQIAEAVSLAKRSDSGARLPLGPVIDEALDRKLPGLLRMRQGTPKSWPGSWFVACAVAKAIRPVVEEIRGKAFGTSEPFKSAETFEEWVRGKGSSKRVQTPLAAPMRGGTLYQVLLTEVREKVISLTGWTEKLALDHVALGRMHPGGFVGVGHQSNLAPPWAQVTFYPWHLNDQYFQRLRSALSKLMLTPLGERVGGWGKPYALENLRLLDLLAEVGAPPQSQGKGKAVGRSEYWQRLSVAWGKRYKEPVMPSALRMRWERFAATHPEDLGFF